MELYDVTIHDLEGRELEHRNIENNTGIEVQEFDVPGYTNGLYFMELKTVNSTVQKRFIIQQ